MAMTLSGDGAQNIPDGTIDGTTETDAFRALPRNARLVMFSDFLDDPHTLAADLRRYVDLGVQGVLVRIIDPAEEALPYDGRVLFEGPEDEGQALIERVGDARAEYQNHWRRHGEQLFDIARQGNWQYVTHHTNTSPNEVLLRLYMVLSDIRLR